MTYDRDDYNQERADEARVHWKVTGWLKVRLVQGMPDGRGVPQDDVDTAIWIAIPWTRVGGTPDGPDDLYRELLAAVAGHADALLGVDFTEDDVEDQYLFWEVDG